MDRSKLQKVTIYWVSPEWGGPVKKMEAKLVEHGVRKYAQYPKAPYVIFFKKRSRRPRHLVCFGHDHYLLILDGWGHPEPPSPFSPARREGDVIVQEGRHAWVGGPWEQEMDARLQFYLGRSSDKIVADYRSTQLEKVG